MRKRTVIITKMNDDWTAYVQNYGIEELTLFKKLKDNGIELKDDGNLSDEEMCMLLNHCCEDAIVDGVFSIENHFNRDQREINKIKENIEKKLKVKGYTIIAHTDWKPTFGDGGGVINRRNYLTLLIENIEEKERELNDLEKELDDIQKIISDNDNKILKQNELISENEIKYTNTKSNLVEAERLLNNTIERYNKGKKICDDLEKNMRDTLPNDLKEIESKVIQKQNELNSLEKQILSKNSDIYNIDKEIKSKKENLEMIKNEYTSLDIILDKIIDKTS